MKIRKGRPLPAVVLDAIDRQILDALRRNGRATNREIAEKLSIHHATVSARIARLEESRAMRVVAVSDFSAHGLNVLVAVGVKVKGRPVEEVGRDIAAMPEVLSANITVGPYDLELLVGVGRFEDVVTSLFDRIGSVPGVDSLHTRIAAEIIKFEFDVAPL